ncbi:hypothetical protein GQ457_09G001940 [Hibiscus cannabinus]
MFEGKAIVGKTDVLQTMQKDGRALTNDLQEHGLMDLGGQCVVGTDFSSFVTHNHGCFMHFCVGSLAILLFRGAVNQAHEANLFPKFEALDA